jgi:hypothetical protein
MRPRRYPQQDELVDRPIHFVPGEPKQNAFPKAPLVGCDELLNEAQFSSRACVHRARSTPLTTKRRREPCLRSQNSTQFLDVDRGRGAVRDSEALCNYSCRDFRRENWNNPMLSREIRFCANGGEVPLGRTTATTYVGFGR